MFGMDMEWIANFHRKAGVPVKGTYLKTSSLDLLDANHLQRKQLIQRHDSIHHHLGEEVFLTGNKLGVQSCGCTLLQQLPLLSEMTEQKKTFKNVLRYFKADPSNFTC